jgi:hypothetical protein
LLALDSGLFSSGGGASASLALAETFLAFELARLGSAFSLIGKPLAQIGISFAHVGFRIAMIGDPLTLI